MDHTPRLERIIERLDRNPFESLAKGRTKPIYALSDLKVDSTFFNETSWKGLTELHKELPGPILIAGGLFDSCKYFFTKSEVVKFPRHAYKGGWKETISDELQHKKDLAVERLNQLGPTADIHYFYGPKDVKNLIELYNERINIFTTKIQATCKTLVQMGSELGDLENQLERLDSTYRRKRESEEKAYASGTPTLSKLKLRYLRRQLQTNRYNLKTAKSEETKARLEEKIRVQEAYLKEHGVKQRDPIATEGDYRQKIAGIEKEYLNNRSEIISNATQTLATLSLAATQSLDHILQEMPFETLEKELGPFRATIGARGDLENSIQTHLSDTDSTTLTSHIRTYSKTIRETLNDRSRAFCLYGSSYKLHKRDISKELRHSIIDHTKHLYKTGIENLLDGSGGKLSVHEWIQTATSINGAWVLATGFSGGFSDALKQRNYSRLRTELFGQKTKGDWNAFIDDHELEKLTSQDGSGILHHLDLVIAGNDNVFRWGPLDTDPDCRNERPTDVITLAPFYDIENARQSHNREYIKADETHFAKDPRATSGFAIIDFDAHTTTRIGWIHPTMVDATIKLARDAKDGKLDGTLNGINSSDDHPGQVHVRYENLWGTTALRLLDTSILWLDLLGDAFQGHNYRGTHTEGRTKIIRLDDQAREYMMYVRESIKEVILTRKSPLIHPVAYTIGNHDKPLEHDFGVDLISFALEQLNLEIEDRQRQTTGLATLTPERICSNLEYKKTELGYRSHLDNRPIRSYWSGHDGYGRRPYDLREQKTPDGTIIPMEKVGDAIICHKSIMGAGGDKMDPIHRIALYTKETGRITPDIRELKAGHIHIPMVGNINDGINVCVNPSSESMDKKADFPWATESIFGIMVGFTVPTGGAWKSYVSRDPSGPIFYEFMHLGITRPLYEQYIEPSVKKAYAGVPDGMKVNLTR